LRWKRYNNRKEDKVQRVFSRRKRDSLLLTIQLCLQINKLSDQKERTFRTRAQKNKRFQDTYKKDEGEDEDDPG
jgi:hypothetical protein